MNILVTGAAGFIGAALAQKLLKLHPDWNITGLDNINDYYDQRLKLARLELLGVKGSFSNGEVAEPRYNELVSSDKYPRFRFIRLNLQDVPAIDCLFKEGNFDFVVNLAAQAGVRYSIENPRSYVESNVAGFLNILEGCRNNAVKHLVYASSSSVYGLNAKVPFSEHDSIAHPVSLYAATKKANELMAHTYSHLYGIPTTGLRFFTVYGPWGRPDMSPFLFIDAILNDREIKVFNNGDMWRDFTYIDDIVESISRIITVIPQADERWNSQNPDPATSSAPYVVYNIGNSNPVNLKDYIAVIEDAAGKKAKKKMMDMQPGDVYRTYADSSALQQATGFKPSTPLTNGIQKTVDWFRTYFKI